MVNFLISEFFMDRVLYELVGHLVMSTALGILYFYTKNKLMGIASIIFLIIFFVRLGMVVFY